MNRLPSKGFQLILAVGLLVLGQPRISRSQNLDSQTALRQLMMTTLKELPAGEPSRPETNHDYWTSFEERREKVLKFVAETSKGPSFFGEAARFALNTQLDTAITHIRKLLEAPSGDMFFSFPFMGFYLHFGDRLPQDLREKCEDIWRTYAPYRGDTENHWVMYYTAILLAAQTWPNKSGAQWFNGKSSQENYDEALGWLNHWVEITTTIGQGEFDSPDYFQTYLAPWILLYDFAKDPALKQKAKMILDYLLADYAAEYLHGMYTGGHSRIYEPAVYDPKVANATALGYLYFGDTDFLDRSHVGWAVFPALSSYRVPPLIVKIATDRSTPYVHRERKRVRNVIRYGDERNPPVFKYDYMTKDYCLGSLQGGILQPIQQHTWDVMFATEDGLGANVFTLHPFYSAKELAMFFPEEPEIMVREVVKSKVTYDKEDKWTGSSPYEQTFQHKNAIIVLYDIAPGTTYEHIDGFFPKSLKAREVDPSGWIFCWGGNTYIAYYPLKPYRWIEESVCYRLRSPYRRNGLVMEVASAGDYASFEDFKKQIRSNRLDVSRFDRELTVLYQTSAGDRMEFTYGGPRLLNGQEVRFSGWPLFDGPFLQSKVGSGELTMTHGREKRILDFNALAITEQVF